MSNANGFPWVNQKKGPQHPSAPLAPIAYGSHLHQVQCMDCTEVADQQVDSQPECRHPVLFVEKQLVVNSDDFALEFPQFEPTKITPELLIGPRSEAVYTPPESFNLYTINTDPFSAIRELNDIPDAPAASANYIHKLAPGWSFGPYDVKKRANGPMATEPMFHTDSYCAVVDDFGSVDPDDPVAGHGEFIESIVVNFGVPVHPVDLNLEYKTPAGPEPWPFFGDQPSVAAALFDARTRKPKPKVVNLSFGTYPCTPTWIPDLVKAEIDEMLAAGIEVVAAAGNDSHGPADPLFYPAGYDGVRSVGAVGWEPDDNDGTWYIADFSNTRDVSDWAPGVAIVGRIGDDLWQWSGTSFAAPMIAACIAGGSS